MHRRITSNTTYAHKIDAYESKRCRTSVNGKHKHEEHSADRGYNSRSLDNLVHLPMPIQEAIRIPEVKVTVDEWWNKLKSSAMLARIQSKKQKRSDRGSTTKRQTSPWCNAPGLMPPKKNPNWTNKSSSTKRPSYNVVMHWRMIHRLMQCSLNKVPLHRNGQQPKYQMSFRDCQIGQAKPAMLVQHTLR